MAVVTGANGADLLASTSEVDSALELSGGDASITSRGGDGSDDVLFGGAGDDLLDGLGGSDALNGAGGDDTLVGGLGSNVLEGGAGQDTASYAWATRSVVVRLADGFAWVGGEAGIPPAAEDALFGVEHAVGGQANDTLVGDGGANSFFGGGGGDSVSGGAGADYLSGDGGNDVLAGGRGDDTLVGGAGDDGLDGGAGSDTAAYTGRRSDYAITPVVDGSVEGGLVVADARSGGEGTDTVTGAELFAFSDGVVAASELAGEQPAPDPAPSPPPATFFGTPADDRLWFQPGDEVTDGLAGHDWVDMLAEGRRASTVAARSDGSVAVSHDGQGDALLNVEEVRFLDGRLAFDAADPAARVARLYGALDRLPDQGGLNFWIDAVRHGHALSELAQGFIASGEFQARFGGATSSNGAFVDQLYQNVLGRAGEQGGRDFWVGSLDRGAASRADVLVAFSEGAENKAGTAALVNAGIWDRSEAAAEVARLYDTVFGRLPDAPGLAAWKDAIEAGRASLLQVADSFTGSAEFKAQYGALNNRDFADALYVNTLDRPADQAGLDHWTNALNSGVSRAEVVLAFSESAEHVALTAPSIQSDTPGQYGILFA